MTVEPAIIVAALSLAGTVVAAWLAWRGARANAKASEAKAYAEQVNVAVGALTGTVETLSGQAGTALERSAALDAKVSVLEKELHLSRVYESMLIRHINEGLPPPPPARPTAA